jgi:hypothetical protein
MYPVQILADTRTNSVESLFVRAVQYQKVFAMDMFYGNTEDQEMMTLLYDFNLRREDTGLPTLKNFNQARFLDQKQCIQIITRYSQQKLLRKGGNFLLRLTGINPDTVTGDYPDILALGYALSILSDWKPEKTDKPRNPQGISEFDVFAEGKKNPQGGNGI